MIRYNQLRGTFMPRGHVAVPQERLEHLERVEQAHDAYLNAAQTMRLHATRLEHQRGGMGDREQGYLDCLRDFSNAVLEAMRRAA